MTGERGELKRHALESPTSRAAQPDLHRIVRERLAERDQRYTASRRSIVDTLLANGPTSLPELLSRQPRLAQSSAYRNLSAMEEAGVVRRLIHGTDHARYELADEFTGHHHHVICQGCGLVRDITLPEALEHSFDGVIDEIADAHGFVARHHTLDVYGLCASCFEQERTR